MSKPNNGRYGQWAGNPRGHAEDKTRCVEEVWPNDRGVIQHQCYRKRGHGPNNEYCKQHAQRIALMDIEGPF